VRCRFLHCLPAVVLLFLHLLAPFAQGQRVLPLLITQNIDETKLVTLGGNTRPEASPRYDRGPVADDFAMEHLFLLLKRSPEQERELDAFINELHDSSSPSFHRWLTAEEFGEKFGLAQQDRSTIQGWLQSHGLKVNIDYPNGLLIDFSGTAAQIRDAFHTEIHNLDVNGAKHIANMSDPKIPAALSPAIVGVVSLHDFRPHAMYKPRADYTVSEDGSEHYLVVPGDLATIYNLKPLFSASNSGQGQTVVVIEDSDVFAAADWTSFRSTFGLSSFTDGSFAQTHPAAPSGTNNCSDPGVIGSDREAIIDAEYASSAAPSAAIVLSSCADTATFGGLIALQNLVNASTKPPAVVSMSYGICEAANGASSNAAFNSTFAQAVTEGVSVFVAAGDNGATSCDKDEEDAIYGIGITGWGSSPHVVSVGGTDFGDTFAHTNSTYWSGTNSSTFESAKSYIPEIPWNDSCGSLLLAEFNGFAQTYGTSGFCNSSKGEADFLDTSAGGGGPSGCATGAPAVSNVVGGTCAGWAKPSYQSVVGNPKDGVRDIPDVSIFAAAGVWLHAYPYCFSGSGGVACTEAPVNWPQAGGTSFAAPIMAGIQALINQRAGARQGNPNFVYYKLAAAQYGTSGDKACNSTLGKTAGTSCIFYDITEGDNDVDCTGTVALGINNCFLPSGTNGALSTSNSAYDPAYAATTGWDFATGIGSINAFNLVSNWPGVAPNFALSSDPAALTLVQGGKATSTINIDSTNGFDGTVTLAASGLPSGVTAAFSPNPGTSTSTLTLTATSTATTGAVTAKITGTSGTLTNSTTLSLTVDSLVKSFTLSASPDAVTIANGGAAGKSTVTITPVNGFTGDVTLAASGLPTGVTAVFSPNPATSTSTLSLTASSTATTGTVTVTITGTSGSLKETAALQLTVTQAPNYTLSASPSSLSIRQSSTGTSTITIAPLNGFDGSVTFAASGLPAGVTAAFSPNPGTTSSKLTLTVSATAATGTPTVTITGTSGSLKQATTVTLTVTPDYTLSASPNSLGIVQGASGKSTISITDVSGFDGSVTLAASGLPSGVTAAFSPNPATTSSTLTLTASATATTGSATATITGTSASLKQTTTLALTIKPAPNFTLSASPTSLSIVQVSSSTSKITVTPTNGFSGSVTLAASGLPKGVTAVFGPDPATSSSTLTLTVSATAAPGTSTVTITGTSGSLSHTTSIQHTVTPGLTLTASPNKLTIAQGGTAVTTIIMAPLRNAVTLSVSGLPSGVTAKFSSNPALNNSELTFTASSTAAEGTFTVTVTGLTDGLTASTTITLTVQ
jgi:subtilase family serine protease